jgi:hypothetical protein
MMTLNLVNVVSKNAVLLGDNGLLSDEVQHLNFDRLKHKMTKSAESEMSEEGWDLGEKEYRRFLTLKKLYPAVSLVPSKQVDLIWHAHILDTRAYREDCNAVFGRFIDHYPYFGIYGDDDSRALKAAFDETVALYESHFGAYPAEKNPMRCGDDHACHAPSSCACRVPSACK